MKKEYKEFVINQLYGLMEGSTKSLEDHMNRMFPEIFGFKADQITVIESKHKFTENPQFNAWIGAMLATITIDNESFSFERDFGEEYEYDIKHPDYETDDWFYEGDKCYSQTKFNEAIKNIEDMNEIDIIESLLDLNDDEIRQLYNGWNKGDCSLVGITEIYLYQCIKKHKQENGVYYDTDYDKIRLRYGKL